MQDSWVTAKGENETKAWSGIKEENKEWRQDLWRREPSDRESVRAMEVTGQVATELDRPVESLDVTEAWLEI